MSTELTMLLWSVAFAFVQVLVAMSGASLQVPMPVLAGNREKPPELEGWAGRAHRAHRNMMENLPPFIALVLIAQVAGKTNAMTALGAELFFWGRLAHGIIYVAGIPWIRTLAWLVAVVGMIMIFLQLV
jgi:uncharacterized MAPEG superfamily protein